MTIKTKPLSKRAQRDIAAGDAYRNATIRRLANEFLHLGTEAEFVEAAAGHHADIVEAAIWEGIRDNFGEAERLRDEIARLRVHSDILIAARPALLAGRS